jgi:hypothetical protein
LADEFEAAFGRQQLDELLVSLIPDNDYAPGLLHTLLLQLPWADVLTTNYDTLLERAAPHILGRRYDIVRTHEEIPFAMRPRIVKLHGSFPCTRPFIISEEDFRTYPRRFAAFVNLAQEAIMENIFCLLGFSGDDPNFLYWSGWVRDFLGAAAPRIYLCGLLNLNDAQRRLLDKRNVTLVDLTPLFPKKDFPDSGRRHRLAMEWLLRSLAKGRPTDPMNWPRPAEPEPPSSPDLPVVLAAPHRQPIAERITP